MENNNPYTLKTNLSGAENDIDFDRVLRGLVHAETGGQRNPWIRTKVSPPGGSTAFGPLQITNTTAQDFFSRYPDHFKGLDSFFKKLDKQGNLFKRYGREPKLPGYHPKFDYGGAGIFNSDPNFRWNYLLAQKKILQLMASENNITKEIDLIKRWRGAEPSPQYLQRFYRGATDNETLKRILDIEI